MTRGGLLETIEARIAELEAKNDRLAAEVAELREERAQAGKLLSPAEVRALRRCGQARLWSAIESGELRSITRRGRGGRMCRLIAIEDAKAWKP